MKLSVLNLIQLFVYIQVNRQKLLNFVYLQKRGKGFVLLKNKVVFYTFYRGIHISIIYFMTFQHTNNIHVL